MARGGRNNGASALVAAIVAAISDDTCTNPECPVHGVKAVEEYTTMVKTVPVAAYAALEIIRPFIDKQPAAMKASFLIHVASALAAEGVFAFVTEDGEMRSVVHRVARNTAYGFSRLEVGMPPVADDATGEGMEARRPWAEYLAALRWETELAFSHVEGEA